MRMATIVHHTERIKAMEVIEGPVYLGECEYCGVSIYTDMEHYELPDETLYCSSECLLEDMDRYHQFGEVD